MSISRVDSGNAHVAGDTRSHQRQPRIGEQIELTVLQRIDPTRYQVGFFDGWRVVASTVALPVGATIRATVTAVGDTLELQYLGPDVVTAAMSEHEAKSEDALAEHERRFRISLPEADRLTLQAAMNEAEDVETMVDSGLFLGKLSLPLDAPKLQAVYESQVWKESASVQAGSRRSAASGSDVEQLAAAIEQTLHEPPAMTGALPAQVGDSGDDGEQERRQLAWEMLNDQDGGSVEYRYGVLPLIIADQLFELDLVYFRDRQSSVDQSARSKRMVMTLNAPSLGRVEVLAQAIGDRLSVTIRSDSEASRQILSAEQQRVQELLARLGWGIDAVSYEVGGIETRAAAHVVDHVLGGDSLSRWI